jgi:LPXTG-site transpeptidase (sortase) family protein
MILSNLADFFRVIPKKRRLRLRSKKGVIFRNPPTPLKIIFRLGNIILIFSFSYLVYLYYPLVRAIWFFERQKPAVGQIFPPPTPPPISDNKIYEIQIPRLIARADIVSDVSPYNPAEYLKVLENNVVAQARGSNFPGDGKGKSIYIFAHSTQQGISMIRKNAVFYLLGELAKGDVVFIRYQGLTYSYQVYEQKVVSAKDIQYLQYTDKDKEVLILQTCWPIGTNWKRLLVFTERI